MIQTETTPNPNSIKFLSEKTISDIGTEEFQRIRVRGSFSLYHEKFILYQSYFFTYIFHVFLSNNVGFFLTF